MGQPTYLFIPGFWVAIIIGQSNCLAIDFPSLIGSFVMYPIGKE